METAVTSLIGLCAVVIMLSFLKPASANSGFWHLIEKMRSSLDLLSYWLINLIAVCSFGSVILMILFHLFKGDA